VRRRFFVDKFENQRAVLEGEQAHHLGVVLRAQTGQLYELSDGSRVFLGRVEQALRERVEFALLEELPAAEPMLNVTLFLAIVKFDAFEWAIEKATELGVSEIFPLAAERSEKGLVAAAGKRAPRWSKIIFEAAQQSRRVKLPQLRALSKIEDAFTGVSGDALRLFLSEREDVPPLRRVLADTKPTTEVVLAIGPEGGWTDEEAELAHKAGFRKASLGRLILRTETAVIAAMASIAYSLGDS
jgi:16S rRNA (uracil1498-N3)-methyltransferase